MKKKNRNLCDREFKTIVHEIINNEQFQKLKEISHHNSNIFTHASAVSHMTYRVCKRLNLNYHEAARGALLHDFFLYNWRNKQERPYRRRLHGMEHPKQALINAKENFDLTKREEDIIVKHMWPLTLRFPKYRESFIVSFIDKYLASRELLSKFRKRIPA